ncbi:hypothetical protein EKO04_008684 [Ascochyta lentis]|uniref:NADH:flavin oxidoreductase/NADH oxidase N-terminal domain-containing protein n=1 Tax=Ascochyta lentis TaxID=205686 RepID=A0A8H7MFU1_9PLEO|nr:hypothetical protein EKO04_008684 [Ascochyta lentis]
MHISAYKTWSSGGWEGLFTGNVEVSSKYRGPFNLEESLEQVGLIAAEQIDFLEISGGSYEKPRMAVGDQATRSEKREAFFLDYAAAVRERYPSLILMVTGGFRSRKGMQEALQSGACDLIGIGRPAAIWPHLPKEVLLNEKIEEAAAVKKLNTLKLPWLLRMIPIKFIGTGADTIYYAKQIQAIALGKTTQAPSNH